MPTYDFVCDKCEETFEVSVSIKDYDRYKKQNCPKCNKSDNVRRNYTPPIVTGKHSCQFPHGIGYRRGQ